MVHAGRRREDPGYGSACPLLAEPSRAPPRAARVWVLVARLEIYLSLRNCHTRAKPPTLVGAPAYVKGSRGQQNRSSGRFGRLQHEEGASLLQAGCTPATLTMTGAPVGILMARIFILEEITDATLNKVKHFTIGFGRAGEKPAATGASGQARRSDRHLHRHSFRRVPRQIKAAGRPR